MSRIDAVFLCSSWNKGSPCYSEIVTTFVLKYTEQSFKILFFARAVDLQRLNLISALKIFLIQMPFYAGFPIIKSTGFPRKERIFVLPFPNTCGEFVNMLQF